MRTALRSFEELSKMIGPFNYDLTNPAFITFFEDRTGYMITQCQCGWPEVVRCLTISPFDAHWKLTRAKLQDCWELFTQPVTPKAPVQGNLL